MVGQEPLKGLTCILAPAIGVMQDRVRRTPRRQIAITSAPVTSWAVIVALIDQPTTRREKRSIIAAM